jgi:hypothetical protein
MSLLYGSELEIVGGATLPLSASSTCWEDDLLDSYTLFDSVDSCTLSKQPPNMVYKLQKKLVAEKKKSVMQKDNSEDTQSQISSFCGVHFQYLKKLYIFSA